MMYSFVVAGFGGDVLWILWLMLWWAVIGGFWCMGGWGVVVCCFVFRHLAFFVCFGEWVLFNKIWILLNKTLQVSIH